METLKIEIPTGFEIDSFDKKSGEIKFKAKPKNVMERIKTVADVLIENNVSPDDFDEECEGLTSDEKAYRILKLLAKSLNEGWVPDWNNSSEYKYVPWFYMDGGSSGFRFNVFVAWNSSSDVGSRLCFKSRELAEYAAKNFTEVYKRFMII
jgi:hypothetical protein